MKKNIAVFASGSGTNAERLVTYFQPGEVARVALVVSNKSDAYVLERAHRLQVPCRVFAKPLWATGPEVLEALREFRIDFIVLAGFLLRVPQALIDAYPGRIVNIHPALLPKFGGKGMYGDRVHRAVLEAGERETGITIHYINERYDEGNILFQAKCEVAPDDVPDTVARKVHALEYEHYPRVVEKLLESL